MLLAIQLVILFIICVIHCLVSHVCSSSEVQRFIMKCPIYICLIERASSLPRGRSKWGCVAHLCIPAWLFLYSLCKHTYITTHDNVISEALPPDKAASFHFYHGADASSLCALYTHQENLIKLHWLMWLSEEHPLVACRYGCASATTDDIGLESGVKVPPAEGINYHPQAGLVAHPSHQHSRLQ